MEYDYGWIPGTNDHSYNQNYYNRSIRKEGVMGLKNINASSCFMNASIQCLVHLKEFNTSIISKKKPKEGSLVSFYTVNKAPIKHLRVYFSPK